MAAGNKSSSSLVHPVSFFSPCDSFLISRVWSCMCTWHLRADVTPPRSVSAHNAHPTRTRAEARRRGFTITVSFVLPGGLLLLPAGLFAAVIDFFSGSQMSFLFLWKLFIWKWHNVATTLVELFSPLSEVATSRGNSLCCRSLFGWFCQQKLIGVHFNSPPSFNFCKRGDTRTQLCGVNNICSIIASIKIYCLFFIVLMLSQCGSSQRRVRRGKVIWETCKDYWMSTIPAGQLQELCGRISHLWLSAAPCTWPIHSKKGLLFKIYVF